MRENLAKVHLFLLLGLTLIGLLVTGCERPSLPFVDHPAEGTVEAMYAALSTGDREAYMDSMLPQNRLRPNPFGLLEGISLFAGPVALDLNPLFDFTFKEVEVSLIKAGDGYALVQAQGLVRYPAIMWETPFCDQHDVRQWEGEWYVDVYAPEREARLARIAEVRKEQLLQDPDLFPAESGNLWGDLMDSLGAAGVLALNLCEAAEANASGR